MTRIDPVRPDEATLQRAAEILNQGGLVVAPTETRYGLLVRADRQPLLESLYAIKRRDLNQATAILVRGLEAIEALSEMTPSSRLLAARFLPGPLTLVLRSRMSWTPPRVVDGKIGFRWSSSAVIDRLLSLVNCPLTATSANISGRPDPESVEEARAQLGDRIGLYLDAGPLTGPTSTVVDCTGETVRILREGAIPRREIEQILSDTDVRRD